MLTEIQEKREVREKEAIKKVAEITGYHYESYQLLEALEDMLIEYEQLEEIIIDFKQDVTDNYRRLTDREMYGEWQ